MRTLMRFRCCAGLLHCPGRSWEVSFPVTGIRDRHEFRQLELAGKIPDARIQGTPMRRPLDIPAMPAIIRANI